MNKRHFTLKTVIVILLTVFNFTFACAQKMYGNTTETTLPEFDIPKEEFVRPNSIYYFRTIENKFNLTDTVLTSREILSLTRYYADKKLVNPKTLDSLANKAYKLIEEKKYQEAIVISKQLLKLNPNNLTGHKEIALAYSKTNHADSAKIHQTIMIKIIKAIFEFSDGTYKYPFILNNYFEAFSIYEAVFYSKPSKSTLMLDKSGRLLGAYYGYSSRYDEIVIRYSELSHWRHRLKKGDYIEEASMHK